MSSNTTQAEGKDIEIEDMQMHSDFGFDTSTMFGQLKRKTPLIKPDVSELLSLYLFNRTKDSILTLESTSLS